MLGQDGVTGSKWSDPAVAITEIDATLLTIKLLKPMSGKERGYRMGVGQQRG